MKKLSVALFALVIALAMTAVAQDSSSGSGSSGSTASASKSTTVKGWVSDEKCGAKVNAECAKKCVAGGQKIVFVSDKDKKVWNVDNPDALKDHVGHHVSVTGSVDASAGTVHVDSVKMLGHKKAATAS